MTTPTEMERVFTDIYRENAWGSVDSVSGPGSTRERGADFSDDLLAVLRDLGVTTLLDAPCGDCTWIGPIADAMDQYIGVDIVGEIVERDRALHAASNRRFLRADLTIDPLPRADAILCRDCLVHLSHGDLARALANFRASGSAYLVATTFIGDRDNAEIETGAWRPLNLELPPIGLPAPLALVDERCLHTGGIYSDKRLGVWRLGA